MNLTQDFIHGSTKKSLAAMVLPLLIAMVLNMAYNLVDRIYIGHLPGTSSMALTGLGLTFPIISSTVSGSAIY